MDGSCAKAFAVDNSSIVNVLVVDDDPLVLETVALLVTVMGFSAHRAKDGLEALELFRAQSKSFPLVIMDVEMPRLGGIEATKKIREINPSAKVILCSGHTKRDVSLADPDAFLSKPFFFHDLREVIQRVRQQDLLPARSLSLS